VNPLESALAGFQTGQQILGQQQRAQAQNALIMAQQAEAQAKAQQVQAEVAAAQSLQNDMADLVNQFEAGNVKPSTIVAVMGRNPQLGTPIKAMYDQLTDEQKTNEFRNASEVYSAMRLGQLDTAKAMLQTQLDAARNSGDMQRAGAVEGILKLADLDAAAATAQLAVGLAGMDPTKFENTEKALFTFETAPQNRAKLAGDIAKQAADLGLTKVQTQKALQDIEKGNVDIAKARVELANAENIGGGILPPDKRFDAETNIRKEYSAKAAAYNEARAAYSQMLASANQKNGAGDTALITTFRKILDPGSVVRETEFAQTQNIGGVFTRLDALTNQIRGKGLLNDTQRKEITDLAEKFMNASTEYEKKRRESYSAIIAEYGLNPTNVFGVEAPGAVVGMEGTPTPGPLARPENAAMRQFIEQGTQGVISRTGRATIVGVERVP
jgi:tetratricopeptide (TPR) repeat protein